LLKIDFTLKGFVNKEFIHFNSIDSTNAYCLRNVENLTSGTLIAANEQLSGRGRHGRVWYSPSAQNLYASFIVKPSSIDLDLAILPHITSLAIYKAVEDQELQRAWIKWPNDVYVEGKKLAGILAECKVLSNNTQAMVIGFGVNLNMEIAQLETIDKPATSIFVETGQKIDPNEFLLQIINHLNSLYTLALSTEDEVIFKSWKEASKLIDRRVTLIVDANTSVQGKVIDFNPDYSLVLENSMGTRENFFSGDVSLIL